MAFSLKISRQNRQNLLKGKVTKTTIFVLRVQFIRKQTTRFGVTRVLRRQGILDQYLAWKGVFSAYYEVV